VALVASLQENQCYSESFWPRGRDKREREGEREREREREREKSVEYSGRENDLIKERLIWLHALTHVEIYTRPFPLIARLSFSLSFFPFFSRPGKLQTSDVDRVSGAYDLSEIGCHGDATRSIYVSPHMTDGHV